MATKPVFDDVAPWPEKPAPAVATIGHNLPPLEERIPAEFREALIAERPDFYQKLDDLLGRPGIQDAEGEDAPIIGALQRARCENPDQYAKCGILVNALRACRTLVEKVHKSEKQPHLDAGRLVDAQKNALVTRIEAGMVAVEALQKAYIREQDRLAEIERQKALEAQREADARRAELEELAKEKGLEDALPPPPEPVFVPETYNPLGLGQPVRTDGATVSAGKEWKSRVDDYAKAFKHVAKDAKVREAIDAAIQKLVTEAKGKIDIPGVTIDERAKTSAR
jgi:hypothetical protein